MMNPRTVLPQKERILVLEQFSIPSTAHWWRMREVLTTQERCESLEESLRSVTMNNIRVSDVFSSVNVKKSCSRCSQTSWD